MPRNGEFSGPGQDFYAALRDELRAATNKDAVQLILRVLGGDDDEALSQNARQIFTRAAVRFLSD